MIRRNTKLVSLVSVALTGISLLTGCGGIQTIGISPGNAGTSPSVNNIGTNNATETTEVEVNPEPIETTASLLMVGDNLIHSSVYKSGMKDDGIYNYDHFYEHVKEDVEEADIAIINQETIFVADKDRVSSYPMFGSPTEIGDAAVKAGFDIFAHATNHTLDKNTSGVLETIEFWEENHPDITYLGIHDSEEDSDITYMTKNNIKFAFVNYTYGLNGMDGDIKGKEYMVDRLTDDDIEDTLQEAEENAELTVAILHVGTEYVYEPTEEAQEQVARFIDNGADIVLCAHPHVVEPYEVVETEKGNTGLVFYSLGNFISSQDKMPRTVGGMAKINVKKTETGDNVEIEISDYTMEPLITHMEYRFYTTYKLENYTDELCKKHYILNKNSEYNCEYLKNFFDEIIGERPTEKLVRMYGESCEEETKRQTMTAEKHYGE